jgi:hypothetical protein
MPSMTDPQTRGKEVAADPVRRRGQAIKIEPASE